MDDTKQTQTLLDREALHHKITPDDIALAAGEIPPIEGPDIPEPPQRDTRFYIGSKKPYKPPKPPGKSFTSTNTGGNTTKLNDSLIAKMCKYIKAGNYVKVACDKSGISYPVHYRWMSKGRRGVAPIYVKYMKAIKQAEAELESRIVEHWTDQTQFDWHAAKEFLARRFPDSWGGKENVVVTHQGEINYNVQFNIDFSLLSDEELTTLEKLIRKATKPGADPEGTG